MARAWSTAFVVLALLAGPRAIAGPPDEAPRFATLAEADLATFPTDGEIPTPSDVAALRRAIGDALARHGAPGAAVAVLGPGGVLLAEGFGRASADRAMDARSLFRVGSISKSFISLAVMRLVEKGKLRLDDRVRALAPEVAIDNRFERSHPLTVAHLLEHTSGFDEMRFNEIFDDDGVRRELSLRDVLAVNPRSRVVRWPPGTRHAYSQPGYTMAGYLLEKVTGQPYAEVLATEVFRPLGIDAHVRLDPEARAHLATGHHRGRAGVYVHLLHRPAMNVMISAHGLSRLLALLIGRGSIDGQRFLHAASIARIESSGTLAYGPPTVRYGLGNWGDVSQKIPMRGHGGFMPGYQSFYRYSPDRQFGFAVLVNDDDRWGALAAINQLVFQFLFAGPAPQAPRTALPRADLARWVGHYQMRGPSVEFMRFRTDVYAGLEVSERDGVLRLTDWRKGKTRDLVATGPDRFRHRNDCESSVQFTRTDDGRRALIVGQNYFEEESATWARLRRGSLEGALLLLMTTAWVPLFLLLRRRREEVRVLVWPLVAGLCLAGTAAAFRSAQRDGTLGLFTPTTFAVWALSWAFALAAGAALGNAVTRVREVPRLLRTYGFVVALAAIWITVHLARYGLVGLATWRW